MVEAFFYKSSSALRAAVEAINDEADWAILRLQSPITDRPCLRLGVKANPAARWLAFGFPAVTGSQGILIGGVIRDPSGQDARGVVAIQLYSDEAAAAQGAILNGASGAPVISDGRVVGHLRRVLPDETMRAQMGAIFACPVDSYLHQIPSLESGQAGIIGSVAFPEEPMDPIAYSLPSWNKLPFSILFLANLSGSAGGLEKTQTWDSEKPLLYHQNLDHLIKDINPRVSFDLTEMFKDEKYLEGKIEIAFDSMADFGPDIFTSRVPGILNCVTRRAALGELLFKTDRYWGQKDAFAFLHQMQCIVHIIEVLTWLTEPNLPLANFKFEFAHEAKPLTALPDNVTSANCCLPGDAIIAVNTLNLLMISKKLDIHQGQTVASLLCAAISHIDHFISLLCDRFLTYPAYRALERTWFSLEFLVSRLVDRPKVTIHVLDVSKRALQEDTSAKTFATSRLYQVLQNKAFGLAASPPYSVLVADFEFGNTMQEQQTLAQLGGIAQACSALFISNVAASFFGASSYENISIDETLRNGLEHPRYTTWNAARDALWASHVYLCLPYLSLGRVSARIASNFEYQQTTDTSNWGGAALALAVSLAMSYSDSSHFLHMSTRLRGVVPVRFRSSEGKKLAKTTSWIISDHDNYTLTEIGFTVISSLHNSDDSIGIFPASIQNGPQRLALEQTLTLNHIANGLKYLYRNKGIGIQSREAIKRYLLGWLNLHMGEARDLKDASRVPLRRVDLTITNEMAKTLVHIHALLNAASVLRLEGKPLTVIVKLP